MGGAALATPAAGAAGVAGIALMPGTFSPLPANTRVSDIIQPRPADANRDTGTGSTAGSVAVAIDLASNR